MFHISECTPSSRLSFLPSLSRFRPVLVAPVVTTVSDLASSTSSSVALRRVRARSSGSACRARRSRGDDGRGDGVTSFSGSHSRRATTTTRVEGGGDENEGDGGGARLVRAHGGEKSRASHPPWHARGEVKEVWKGTIYTVPFPALSSALEYQHMRAYMCMLIAKIL